SFITVLGVEVGDGLGSDGRSGTDAVTTFFANIFAEVEVDDLTLHGAAGKVHFREVSDFFLEITLLVKSNRTIADLFHLMVTCIGHFFGVYGRMPVPANTLVVFHTA